MVKEEPAKDVPSLNQEYLPPVAEPVQAAAKGYPRENPPNPLKLDPQAATKVEVRVDSSTAAPMMMGGEIPGNAGTDYPIFDTIPETKFNCNDQATGGYYADVDEGRCQVSLSILYSIATRRRCQIKGRDGLQSIVCCHVTLQTDMQRTMVCRAGIPRVSRWPQVLFPLPQRHHLRSEGLCLQLVLQRGLRCVQGFLQPQRPDWRRTREGTRTVGRRPVAS